MVEEQGLPVAIRYANINLIWCTDIVYEFVCDIVYNVVMRGKGTYLDGFLKRNSVGSRAWYRNWQPLQRVVQR